MGKVPGIEDHNVDVMVTMRNSLLERLSVHQLKVGEYNRSAWIRQAIVAKMHQEKKDMGILEEVE